MSAPATLRIPDLLATSPGLRDFRTRKSHRHGHGSHSHGLKEHTATPWVLIGDPQYVIGSGGEEIGPA